MVFDVPVEWLDGDIRVELLLAIFKHISWKCIRYHEENLRIECHVPDSQCFQTIVPTISHVWPARLATSHEELEAFIKDRCVFVELDSNQFAYRKRGSKK